MLGVTGPNEYENNVNNNWYTNYIARWCLMYTAEKVAWIKTITLKYGKSTRRPYILMKQK